MDQLPLISIIIPVYNGEKFIYECVDSVLNQTYQNIECILVDGQSPDKCPEICDRYALQDDRVKVIHKENNGLSDDRNAGIRAARGEYLTFVDSDDYISKDMIKVLYDICYKYHVLLSQCNFIRNGKFNDIADHDIKASVLSKEQCLLNLYGQFGMAFCASWGKLYHKSLFENIFFPYGKTHEDVYTTHLYFEKAGKIGYVTKGLYYYRQRDDSLMAKEKKNPDLYEIKANKARGNYLKKRGYLDAYYMQTWVCIRMIRQKYCEYYRYWSIEQRKYMCREYRKLILMLNRTEKVKVDDWFFFFIPELSVLLKKLNNFI